MINVLSRFVDKNELTNSMIRVHLGSRISEGGYVNSDVNEGLASRFTFPSSDLTLFC